MFIEIMLGMIVICLIIIIFILENQIHNNIKIEKNIIIVLGGIIAQISDSKKLLEEIRVNQTDIETELEKLNKEK